MTTSPLSKLVNSWEYDVHSTPGFDWGEFGGIGLGASGSFVTLLTLPIGVQNRTSKLVIDLNCSIYQYGGTTSVRIYVDGELVRTAKTYLATENYVSLAAKSVLHSVRKGIHNIRIDVASSNATPAELYEDKTDGSFLALQVLEITK